MGCCLSCFEILDSDMKTNAGMGVLNASVNANNILTSTANAVNNKELSTSHLNS